MPLTTEIRATISALQTGVNALGNPQVSPRLDKILQFASGVGANQADLVYASGSRVLAASATENLDLAGSLLDGLGNTIIAVKLVALLVVASAANTNDVVLGAATLPIPLFGGTAGTFAVRPGGMFLIAAPALAGQLTIGAGATDVLKVTNSAAGTGVTYDIIVIGRSA